MRGPTALAAAPPRPGRNLGLGRESARPPGPKGGPFTLDRRSEGSAIQRLSAQIGGNDDDDLLIKFESTGEFNFFEED
jgi:hypothetical protein